MKKALIIEDNDDNMALISFILHKAGFDLLEARTGESGVELALQHRPDVIILDIQLPGIDGYEVLRRIRASEIDGSIPIVAMTSFAMAGDRERLLTSGCNAYIEKPIDPNKVVEQIRTAMEENA